METDLLFCLDDMSNESLLGKKCRMPFLALWTIRNKLQLSVSPHDSKYTSNDQ